MSQSTLPAGRDHWLTKQTSDGDVRLFLYEKPRAAGTALRGTVLFIHGSSMGAQPTFDLTVPGRPHSSVMDWFRAQGYDTWCLDNEGYGRSDKKRPINFDISNGADDIGVASQHIEKTSGAK
ncbi:MAG: alpha/beta hydrolase, partial [Burkholderiales bacterium]